MLVAVEGPVDLDSLAAFQRRVDLERFTRKLIKVSERTKLCCNACKIPPFPTYKHTPQSLISTPTSLMKDLAASSSVLSRQSVSRRYMTSSCDLSSGMPAREGMGERGVVKC